MEEKGNLIFPQHDRLEWCMAYVCVFIIDNRVNVFEIPNLLFLTAGKLLASLLNLQKSSSGSFHI